MKPEDMKILVIGTGVWGKGDDVHEALAHMRREGSASKKYLVYIIHPDSYVDGMGRINYPVDYPPKKIMERGFAPGKRIKG